MDKIAVIGLGHVGMPFACAMANVGYEVLGIDVDADMVERLRNTLDLKIFEPGLRETLLRNRGRIVFTTSYDHVPECRAVFISLATGLDERKEIDMRPLESAADALGGTIRTGQVIILRSTVPPGTTERFARRLEEKCGLLSGKDFFVAFCPERTIEGMALHEIYTLPKIIGGITQESTERAAQIMARLGGETIRVSSPRVAELCKFVDNMYRALNIGFANEIALICEKIQVDSYELVAAVNRAYERTHIFKPGLGADGPCLTKDSIILDDYVRKLGLENTIIRTCVAVNELSTLRVVHMVSDFVTKRGIKGPKISLVGLSFKGYPETEDLRGSPATKILPALKGSIADAHFAFYDPVVREYPGGWLDESLEECVKGCNVLLLLTNHPRLLKLDADEIVALAGRPLLIVDSWHCIEHIDSVGESDVEIFRIGDGTRRSS
jgi:UDP-N-acetyl-D-mannosaminuronic acid dehydrogenase